MQDSGLSQQEIKQKLEKLLQQDLSFSHGRILGSMCTMPHNFAKEIFTAYIDKNVGDPGLFPATAELEDQTISMLGDLLSNRSAAGFILTGGSEANILALWTAKTLYKNKGNEVLIPESAHFSFDKAASLLDLRIKKITLDKNYAVNIEELKNQISPNTIALVGIAGTTALGVVDPIPELSRVAQEHDLYLHVDAAFGGFVLPFLHRIGRSGVPFDFSLPGVCSITIDPHKMGMSVIPSGGILYRSARIASAVKVFVPYLSGGETALATIVGTRSGASVLATWAMLKHFGRQGYTEVVKRCMELTDYLAAAVKEITELSLLAEPVLNIVGITSNIISIQELAKNLRKKGWALSLFDKHIRIVLMPHLKHEHIQKFIVHLKETVLNIKATNKI
ncbi:MAG: tyrosine decarboxylase MfnA [Spirochaetales bacterium]|nr:tyrosine decarboxylase MfnA [Spirochaetales bacterium]